MMKYVVLDSHTMMGADYGIETKILNAHGIDVVIEECKTDDEVIKAAADADAIGVIYVKINGALMDNLKKCKVLVRYGIGYDSIVVPDATARSIAVCNLPDYCQPDVATHAFAMILDCCRKITMMDRKLREGVYDSNYGYRIHRLSCLKIGFLGFGAIARKLVEYMKPYNMEMLAFDPYIAPEVFSGLGCRQVALDELLANSDIISLHSPLTKETKHIIDRAGIAKMKDGVIIVNTARGAIICLDDLVGGLESGKIGAVALDTIEGEPNIPLTHPIYSYENVILTPHCAFNSVEAEREQHEKVAKAVIEVLNGNLPNNCINKKELQK